MHAEQTKVRASVTVIVLFMLAAFFARSWYQIQMHQAGFNKSFAYDVSFFGMLPIVLVLMWPVMRSHVAAMRWWFRRPQSWGRLIAYSVLLGVTLRTIFWAFHTAGTAFGWFYDPSVPTVATPQFSFSCPAAPFLILNFLVMAILTPIFEEFMHRGLILQALLPRGHTLAIILSALIFGLMHKPGSIVMAFLIGLVLALLTLNLRALWGPIFVHGTYNFAAIVDWDCVHPRWYPAESTPQLLVVGSVSAVVLLLGVALVLRLLRYAKAGAQLAPRP